MEGDIYRFIADITSKDDGNEILFVNLIQFRDSAHYGADEIEIGGDIKEARIKYMQIMAVELARHASHPIFVSEIFSFLRIGEVSPGEYDEIAIVRYRSVRDFIDIVRRVNDIGGFKHKYASVLRSEVHIARPKLVFPFVKVLFGFLFATVSYILCLLV